MCSLGLVRYKWQRLNRCSMSVHHQASAGTHRNAHHHHGQSKQAGFYQDSTKHHHYVFLHVKFEVHFSILPYRLSSMRTETSRAAPMSAAVTAPICPPT